MRNSSNKQIVKNTAFLYVRMILVMLVTLYTSRVILATLGETDYGIYNVVGGIVTIMGFLNGALGSSTSRFLTYELGTGNIENLKKTFASTLNIHLSIALLVILLGETIGLWFFYAQLNIPEERMDSAFWVYQFSIATTCISFTQVPYNASLISHENMAVYAYVGLYEACSKLLIAYLIVVSPIDRLVFYAGLLLINSTIIQLFYRFYVHQKYIECRFRLFFDKQMYKKLLGYGGWGLFGGVAVVCQNQGINILLNIFFGPSVNAARAIALQIQSGVTMFTNNFMVAARPQVIKRFAVEDYEGMYRLTFYTAKYSYLVMLMLVLPICFEMDFILRFWLGDNIPSYTSIFSILILVTVLMSTCYQGYLMAYHAIGKIKTGNIIGGSLMISALPLSYIVFKWCNADAYWAFIIMFITNLGMQVIGWFIIYRYVPFNWRILLKSVYFPVLLITCIAIFPPLLLVNVMESGWLRFILLVILTISFILVLSWWIAFNSQERIKLIELFLKFKRKYL